MYTKCNIAFGVHRVVYTKCNLDFGVHREWLGNRKFLDFQNLMDSKCNLAFGVHRVVYSNNPLGPGQTCLTAPSIALWVCSMQAWSDCPGL